MNVLFVASELAPYAKTGGLADVMAALPRYLHRAGHDARVFIPLYDTIDTTRAAFRVVLEGIDVQLGPHRYAVTIVASGSEPELYFVHCPALYARGSIYTNDHDEHRRFLALCWAAMAACQSWQWMTSGAKPMRWLASRAAQHSARNRRCSSWSFV